MLQRALLKFPKVALFHWGRPVKSLLRGVRPYAEFNRAAVLPVPPCSGTVASFNLTEDLIHRFWRNIDDSVE